MIRLGTYGHWPLKHTLSLTPAELAMHVHVLGTTGSGKSTFLTHLALEILDNGMSFTLIDPHGDLARDVLAQLAMRGFYHDPTAFERLLYLDLAAAAQNDFYLPFNILRQPYRDDGVADNIVKTMHAAWKELDAGAGSFDVLVDAGIKTLLANDLPITNLFDVVSDRRFREGLLARLSYPEVVRFWASWDQLKPTDQGILGGAALRRSYQLTKSDVLKYSLGQSENVLDFRSLIDQNRSCIVNLHVDGDGVQELLGSLITSMAVSGAKSRSQIAKGHRTGTHFLIIDEFEKFTSKSGGALTSMLSETRKYGLFLVVAHQDWAQARDLVDALQNCGMDISFRNGPLDALLSAKILGRVITKSVSGAGEEDTRETVGMNEQDREFAQELMDLFVGQAYLRKDLRQLPFGLKHVFKRRRSALYKIKTPAPRKSIVDTARIEKRYIETYFRHKDAIDPPRPVATLPAGRSRRVG